jgi:hypothetical protein
MSIANTRVRSFFSVALAPNFRARFQSHDGTQQRIDHGCTSKIVRDEIERGGCRTEMSTATITRDEAFTNIYALMIARMRNRRRIGSIKRNTRAATKERSRLLFPHFSAKNAAFIRRASAQIDPTQQ